MRLINNLSSVLRLYSQFGETATLSVQRVNLLAGLHLPLLQRRPLDAVVPLVVLSLALELDLQVSVGVSFCLFVLSVR